MLQANQGTEIPWAPCATPSLCNARDTLITASIMNRQQPYYEDMMMHSGGYVISPLQLIPMDASIRCQWAFGTGSPVECSASSKCSNDLASYGDRACWWSADQTKDMMAQQAGQALVREN